MRKSHDRGSKPTHLTDLQKILMVNGGPAHSLYRGTGSKKMVTQPKPNMRKKANNS